MMGSILENARQNYPGESGITLLLTLGVGAPYFQKEILRELNLTDWMNLRLTNKRHNMTVKPLREIFTTRCNSRRYNRFQPLHRWPLTGDGGRNILEPSEALGVIQSIPSLMCTSTVSWPYDYLKIRPCTQLQGWLNEKNFAGPCSEMVCRDCADKSANAMRTTIVSLRDKRNKMIMCRACQTHEMSNHPYGFRSCICEQNLGPVEDGGWRCHNCLMRAIYLLLERATTRLKALEYLYRTPEGRVYWDTKANRQQELWSLFDQPWPCPGCLTKLPDEWVDDNRQSSGPTVQFCTACDGIIVKATHGNKWRSSLLAPNRPLRSSNVTIPQNIKETPLNYAALDPKVLTYKQRLDTPKIRAVKWHIQHNDQRADARVVQQSQSKRY